jgi:hypothetical protein
VGQAEDVGHAAGIDEIGDIDLWHPWAVYNL